MDLTAKQTQQQRNDDGSSTSGGTTANPITSDPTHGDGEEAHVEPSEVHWRRSNKGTGGMESSVVLFKPRIHLFACTHPSVSNSLDCNDCLRTSISLQPFVQLQPFDQTRLDCGPCCLQASYPPCVTNTFGMWIFVCVHASVSSTVFQTLVDYGSVSGYKHLPPASWVKHVCLTHVWIKVP